MVLPLPVNGVILEHVGLQVIGTRFRTIIETNVNSVIRELPQRLKHRCCLNDWRLQINTQHKINT
jgi:hypothetical protein